jgi:virginiamycin B lyase
LSFSAIAALATLTLVIAQTITEYATRADIRPISIAAGPDGTMWFTEMTGNKIGRIRETTSCSKPRAPDAASVAV